MYLVDHEDAIRRGGPDGEADLPVRIGVHAASEPGALTLILKQ
jgi:hypothetical protein